MQPVDYTTLIFVVGELKGAIVPSRLEQVIQSDRFTIHLGLKTLRGRQWLTCSWHPTAARLHLSPTVARYPETFTFSQQIWHQVGGLALVRLHLPQAWDRVVVLEFAQRPEAPTLWYFYLEIMGKHSNGILVNQTHRIVTAAHQVNSNQSRLRPVLTGEPYQFPPAQTLSHPDRAESFMSWRGRLQILEQPIGKVLISRYRGLSKTIAAELCRRSGLTTEILTNNLGEEEWQTLFYWWQFWLHCLDTQTYSWHSEAKEYNVLPQSATDQFKESLNLNLAQYYDRFLEGEIFRQIFTRLSQVVTAQQQKLSHKIREFEQKLNQSDRAEVIKDQADLLMANLYQISQGLTIVKLRDFHDRDVEISLDPALTPSQNVQKLYKQYQKQKRAREAIAPLLEAINQEQNYLCNIDTALSYLETNDTESLKEIQQELQENGYSKILGNGFYRPPKSKAEINCYRYTTPQGNEVWIGRNNLQNDNLTFRVATDYDLWFHAQEISGSHVLLRLKPGASPDREELEFAANLAAFYSKARHSEQVAVVYTKPRSVFKPKGAKPGMVVYKQESIIWGNPNKVIRADIIG